MIASSNNKKISRWSWVFIASALALCLLLTACYKKQDLNRKYITRTYLQSACSDPWGTSTSDYSTRMNVTEYLKKAGVYVVGVVVRQIEDPTACNDCNCKTGKTIYVTVNDDDSSKARIGRAGFR